MPDQIIEFIQSNKKEWDVELENSDISLIRRSSTWLGASGKVVYLVFKKGGKVPVLILKTVLNPESGQVLEKEAKNVFFLWEKYPAVCRDVVPEPIELAEINDLPVYVEKAIPGTTLPELAANKWTKKRKYSVLDEGIEFAYDWLLKLIEVVRIDFKRLDHHDIDNIFLRNIKLYRDNFSETFINSGCLTELEKYAEKMEGQKFPFIAGHGDFWGGSLLQGINKQWHIIDWEFYQTKSMSFFDHFMLAVHPGFCIGAKNCSLVDEFSLCFLDNKHTQRIKGSLAVLTAKMDVEKNLIEFMFMMFLISMSLERDRSSQKSNTNNRNTWNACLYYYLENKKKIRILP